MSGRRKAEGQKAAAEQWHSRRDLLIKGGATVASGGLVALTSTKAVATPAPAPIAGKEPYPESRGYVVHDSKKCAGCTTCMLACSLAHYGVQDLSLARIQIIQDSFGKFPYDIEIAVCRQCVTPVCVENCPTGAAQVDTENGNVRRIDGEKCIGCQTCLAMCPQQPHRTVWNHAEGKASKCDLCLDTPFWNEKGGPGGKQACVESCPMKAIQFVSTTPDQKETEGYDVNLRNDHWLNLGLVDSSTVVPPVMAARLKQPTPEPKE